MSQNHPMDIRILQLLRRDFTGKSTRRFGECVLGGDFGWALEFGLNFEEVECRWGDDDLVGAVEFGFVDGADNLLDGREGAVHLEVTADKEFSRHGGYIFSKKEYGFFWKKSTS